ncbi:hypothetical protein BKA63DRAFT_594269 [Paraphoma chrysanthemicola]|nr:hypothetical protein BKA63DRAFT_594269 [Paraphoma chrysanthemicola]
MSRELSIENRSNLVNVARELHIEHQHNHFDHHADTPSKPIKRFFSTVPAHLLDDDFVGHRKLLQDVANSVKSHPKAALYGLRGIGTSRVAAEVARRLYRNTFDRIFWIDAASVTTFMRGMEFIAEALEMPTNCESTSHTNTVKVWMEAEDSGSWLLILDAAENEAVYPSHADNVDVVESKETHFFQRLPQRSKTPLRTILITTNRKEIALQWSPNEAFEVPFLEPTEAGTLLRSMSTDRISREEDVSSLVEELDRNPSAILWAAALIRNKFEVEETISTFLKTWRRSKDRLLAAQLYDNRTGYHPYNEAAKLVAAWTYTIERISQRSKDAIKLLSLAACFDGTRIAYGLCQSALGWKGATLREALIVLLDYRLVSQNPMKGHFCMPQLVGWTVRNWIEKSSPNSASVPLLLRWHLKALKCLLLAFDRLEAKNGESTVHAQLQRRALLPHAAMFERFCRKDSKHGVPLEEDHFRAIVMFAELFLGEGRYKLAEQMLRFARNSPTAASYWKKMAMLRLAESLRNQALVDGSWIRWNTPSILYADKAKFRKAADYQKKAIKELSERHGEDDVRTLDACLELSKIRWQQGRWGRALSEQLRIEAHLRTEQLPTDADSTSRLLQVQAAMVRTYHSMKQPQVAVELAERVALGRARVLGELDMKTIGSEKDFAECLLLASRRQDAIEVLEKVERKLRQNFDFDDEEVRRCVAKLDGVRAAQTFPA